MHSTRHLRTASLSLAAAGLAVAASLSGCSNGLVTSSGPGEDPGLEQATASPQASPTTTPEDGTSTPADPTASATGEGGDPGQGGTSPGDDATGGTGDEAGSGGDAGSGTQPSSTGDASGEQVATCATGDLEIGVETANGGGAAGSSYAVITFTNGSDDPCRISGYAGVSLVGGGDGTQLGAAAERAPGDVRPIVLIPGDSDSELLQITNAQNFEESECAPTTADGLRIYPPESTEAAYVPFEVQACQSEDVQQLTVSPVGTSG